MMQSGNPALTDGVFRDAVWTGSKQQVMTLNGVVIKTGLLLAILSATAVFTWSQTMAGINPYGYMLGGLIGGGILALITCFKPTVSPYTSPIYAACQGLALGGISAALEVQYPGIAIQAVGCTFGTLACLLMAFSSGIARPSEKFKLGIMAATGGIALVYLATFVLGFFNIDVPYIHGNGLIGIGFSVFVVILAALNLLLDFDFIERGIQAEAPKYMEWYAAFSLLVTLVWLYLEILRLLSKLRSRD